MFLFVGPFVDEKTDENTQRITYKDCSVKYNQLCL